MGNDLKIKLIAFDVDGTLIDDTVFIWETLHKNFSSNPNSTKIMMEKYLKGEISYKEWFEHDILALKEGGATLSKIKNVLSKLSIMKGAEETLIELKKRGFILTIISGSLNIVTDYFFGKNNYFNDILINKIYFDQDGNISHWEPTPFDMSKKSEGLIFLCEKYGISLNETAFIGDHFNDISIAKIAGLSIAFNSKSEELNCVSKIVIKEKDLRLILPYFALKK